MRKRILAFSLTLILVLSTTAQAARLPEFQDVTPDDWFYDGVQYAYENGLMNGTGDGLFSPNDSTTRGMIVTIIYRLEKEPVSALSGFHDVPSGQWYAKAVGWASAKGIVNGYSETSFGPNDSITRQQLAAILYRYAGTNGYDTSGQAMLSVYSDYNNVESYAVEAMAWAVASGLINGTSADTLSPNGLATRAQVAIILSRFCQMVSEPEDKPDTLRPAGPDTSMTYEEYRDMSGVEKQEYMESFEDIESFFAWLEKAKQEYDDAQNRIEIGGDGSVDLGDILGGIY